MAVTTTKICDFHWYVPQVWPWGGLSQSPPACFCRRPALNGLHFLRSGHDKYVPKYLEWYLTNIRSIGVIGETVDDILDLFVPISDGFDPWAEPTATTGDTTTV